MLFVCHGTTLPTIPSYRVLAVSQEVAGQRFERTEALALLYFLGVTAASFIVVSLVNLNDERATLELSLAISIGVGALAWLAESLSAAYDRRRQRQEQTRAEGDEARRRMVERLAD